jgi:ABC-type bacteriocin/lantibiotic exporter with double-glycine peptidase domain
MLVLPVPYLKQTTPFTCGPVALQMVLAYYGITTSEGLLSQKLNTNSEIGTRRLKMREVALEYSLNCYVNNNSAFEEFAFLVRLGTPVIIRFLETDKNEDHYGVVIGASHDAIVVHDPWNGPSIEFQKDDFIPRWTCDVIGDCHKWLMAVSRNVLPPGNQY